MTGLTKQTLLLAALIALAAMTFVHPMHAGQEIVLLDMPSQIEVAAGHRPFMMMHATGTQNQICLPRANGVGLGWTFYGPLATLFNAQDEQALTHYLSPNPDEAGTARAAWQHSRDASTIWAVASRTRQ